MSTCSLPALTIDLRFETPMRVSLNCLNDGEEARLLDWIGASEARREFVEAVFELAKSELSS